MRHSASPRSMSTRRNVKRPAWSAERRLQRATSRTGPSVSAAPLAMCCILCSHGSFVHPPSAKTAHRATIYAQTAGRSEEHTSELQSQSNLVCRLLLEKKKLTTSEENQCTSAF